MKYNDYVEIYSKNITGIMNPQLVVEGKMKLKNSNLKVYVDGELMTNELININSRGKFFLMTKLDRNSKKIVVCLENDNKNYEIIKMTNNVIRRINFKLKKIASKIIIPLKKIGSGIKFLWKEHHFLVPPILWGKYFKKFVYKIKVALNMKYYNPFKQSDYLKWIEKNEDKPVYKKLKYKPLISILIPVYNISREYLSECLDSILNQKYKNFEICIADDCSTLEETKETLREYEKKDKRIKVVYRKENGHISKATNSALQIAKGEFVGLMDNDDVITENALYEMVYVLNKNKDLDMIYSDEDKIDIYGNRCEPHFKPDYSPDSLLGGNYICHFEILRRSIMNEIGGFRSEYVGAQDFDLFLRFIEKTTADRIYHIPKILYHWRKVPGSTADTIESKDYAIDNGKRAVEDALKRRKIDADVIVPIKTTHYIVEYKYKKEPLVSIIIPTRDLAQTLDKCLSSIYLETTYKNYEVIIVNNASKEPETFELFDKYKKRYKNFKVIDVEGKFNYSKINNIAVDKSKGEYLLFLNNDTQVCTPTWIDQMVGYAMQKHIGAVGVKLLYPDDTIQHGGVILGIGESKIAQHAFLHADANSFGFYGRLLVPYNYSSVTAACMMVNKEKFYEAGKFDENLEVAFNDVDLNLKLLKNKYYNVFLPQVELFHYESKSRGLDTTTEKYKLFLQEVDYMHKNWGYELKHDRFYNPNFSLEQDFVLDKEKYKN